MENQVDPTILLLMTILASALVFALFLHTIKNTHPAPTSTHEMSRGDMVKARVPNHPHYGDGISEKLWMEVKDFIHHEKRVICTILDHPSLLQYKKINDEVTINLHEIEEYIRRDKQDTPYSYYVLTSYF